MSCKWSVVFVCLMIGLAAIEAAGSSEKPIDSGYETKYDNIDLDELLSNDRLRKGYIKCLANEGPCTPDGQELKSNVQTKLIDLIRWRLQPHHLVSLNDFLDRLTTRRNRHQLFKVHEETTGWIGQGDTLSDR